MGQLAAAAADDATCARPCPPAASSALPEGPEGVPDTSLPLRGGARRQHAEREQRGVANGRARKINRKIYKFNGKN